MKVMFLAIDRTELLALSQKSGLPPEIVMHIMAMTAHLGQPSEEPITVSDEAEDPCKDCFARNFCPLRKRTFVHTEGGETHS